MTFLIKLEYTAKMDYRPKADVKLTVDMHVPEHGVNAAAWIRHHLSVSPVSFIQPWGSPSSCC